MHETSNCAPSNSNFQTSKLSKLSCSGLYFKLWNTQSLSKFHSSTFQPSRRSNCKLSNCKPPNFQSRVCQTLKNSSRSNFESWAWEPTGSSIPRPWRVTRRHGFILSIWFPFQTFKPHVKLFFNLETFSPLNSKLLVLQTFQVFYLHWILSSFRRLEFEQTPNPTGDTYPTTQ